LLFVFYLIFLKKFLLVSLKNKMATSSLQFAKRRRDDDQEQQQFKKLMTTKKEEEVKRGLWTCSNPLFGQCLDHDYKEREMLDERKIRYWPNEEDCKNSCGLPNDLVGTILSSSDEKTRSKFRELAPSIRSLIPLKFLQETIDEKKKRNLLNEIVNICTTGLPNEEEEEVKDIKNLIIERLNGDDVTEELLTFLIIELIDSNCQNFLDRVLNPIYFDKINILTNEDWYLIIDKLLKSRNPEISKMFLSSIMERKTDAVKYLLENNISVFNNFAELLPLPFVRGQIAYNLLKFILSSPTLLSFYLLYARRSDRFVKMLAYMLKQETAKQPENPILKKDLEIFKQLARNF
jgi:hypothetical protein